MNIRMAITGTCGNRGEGRLLEKNTDEIETMAFVNWVPLDANPTIKNEDGRNKATRQRADRMKDAGGGRVGSIKKTITHWGIKKRESPLWGMFKFGNKDLRKEGLKKIRTVIGCRGSSRAGNGSEVKGQKSPNPEKHRARKKKTEKLSKKKEILTHLAKFCLKTGGLLG